MQQQASVEKFSDLIGDIYDCVITPGRWTAVLDEICAEFGFATGALSVASLTNMKAVVNAVSGSDLTLMARNAIAYGPDIIELWGGAARIQQYPLGEPIVITASGPFPRACSMPLPSASFATRRWSEMRSSASTNRPAPSTMGKSAGCAFSRPTSGAP